MSNYNPNSDQLKTVVNQTMDFLLQDCNFDPALVSRAITSALGERQIPIKPRIEEHLIGGGGPGHAKLRISRGDGMNYGQDIAADVEEPQMMPEQADDPFMDPATWDSLPDR